MEICYEPTFINAHGRYNCAILYESNFENWKRSDGADSFGIKAVFILINGEPWLLQPYSTSIKVKELQRSFRHSDTERLSRSDEVLKLKNFKKDAILKLFKSTNQERYEHVGPEVTRSHGGKIYKMAKQDYAWLMISRCSRSHSRQAKEQAQDLKSMITTSNHKIND
ncbi:hypothetical protein Tco_0715984 [Tanacetum coccineum]